MQFKVFPHDNGSGDWVVQAINLEGDGEIYTTIFSGRNSKRRAHEYHDIESNRQALAA